MSPPPRGATAPETAAPAGEAATAAPAAATAPVVVAEAAGDRLAGFPQDDVAHCAAHAAAPIAPPPPAAEHRQDEEEKHEREPDQCANGQPAFALALLARLLGHLGGLLGRKFQLGDNLIRPPANPAGKITVAKIGLHAFHIFEGEPVGDHTFEAIADLDPHLALVRRDDEQDAVVVLAIAQGPFAAQAIAVIGDVIAFEVGDRRDHELPLAALFERIELFGQRGFGGVVDDVRRIDHRCGAALREGLRGGGLGKAQHRRQRQDYTSKYAHGCAAQFAGALSERMSSVGATSAPCVTAS